MKDFKDHFSKQAHAYKKYRPGYPGELFQYLNSLTAAHDLAWDCATGNGQSALGLSNYFTKVYATDASVQQLENASAKPNIIYKKEKAENCSLKNASADLITVAQAVHWFNFDKFYDEVKRVLKPEGVVAVWTYTLPFISEEIAAEINYFHDNVVGEFWQKENKLVSDEYKSLPFPFEEVKTPDFNFKKEITLNDLLGLFKSWSAVQRYKDQTYEDPVKLIEKKLRPLWKEKSEKQAT